MTLRRSLYAYILLSCLAVLVAAIAVVASIRQIDASNRRFCGLVAISNQYPVPIIDATGAPENQRARAMYDEYAAFGKELGCP